ncbi:hypothetical protein RIF29_11644 [Crotalaria pallida]|uniref:Uncharacterized protein n=1 Tax=Crotalaria pallida TaxID=3830 RepID=A0AAN9P067_CROPI
MGIGGRRKETVAGLQNTTMSQQKVIITRCDEITKVKNMNKSKSKSKMKNNATVIPAKRKLVKTMVFEAVLDFIIHLPNKTSMVTTALLCNCRRSTKRIWP